LAPHTDENKINVSDQHMLSVPTNKSFRLVASGKIFQA